MKRWHAGILILLALAACAFLVFALGWGFGRGLISGYHVYNEGCRDAQDSAQQNGDYYIKLADLLAQWVMAFGTLFVFGWTVKALRHAERTAAEARSAASDALAETKRSVNASISRDRGRLFLAGIEPSEEGGILMPNFCYQNIGETAVLLLDSSFMFHVFNTRAEVNSMPVEVMDNGPNREERQVFRKHDLLWRRNRTDGMLSNPAPPTGVSEEELRQGTKWLVLRGWILYNTVFRRTRRQWVAMIYQPQRGAWTIAEMGRWNRDRLVRPFVQ